MRKPVAVLALAASLAFSTSACSANSSPIKEAQLAKKLENPGGLKPDFAKCVAGKLYKTLSDAEKKDLNAAQPTADETKLSKRVKAAGQDCKDSSGRLNAS